MPEASDVKAVLEENLQDAGCDRVLAEQIMALQAQGRRGEGVVLLTQHRAAVLERCHKEQKKLDCLDYLIYQMSKQTNQA